MSRAENAEHLADWISSVDIVAKEIAAFSRPRARRLVRRILERLSNAASEVVGEETIFELLEVCGGGETIPSTESVICCSIVNDTLRALLPFEAATAERMYDALERNEPMLRHLQVRATIDSVSNDGASEVPEGSIGLLFVVHTGGNVQKGMFLLDTGLRRRFLFSVKRLPSSVSGDRSFEAHRISFRLSCSFELTSLYEIAALTEGGKLALDERIATGAWYLTSDGSEVPFGLALGQIEPGKLRFVLGEEQRN